MGRRGKVVFARINDERKRRETLKKRKAGLLKKVSELTILCGLEAAVIVYTRGDSQPTVWPSTSEAKATISKFLKRPILERKARSHNIKSFTLQKCKRLKNKAERLKQKNDKRITQALITSIDNGKTRIQDLDSEQQKQLSDFADKRKEELLKHIKRLKRKEKQATHQPQALPSVLQKPPEAASGLNINGLAVGRNFSSPASAAHGQLMNHRGMKRLAPPLYLHRQTPHPLVMPPYKAAANRLNMTGRAASGININDRAYGGNFPSLAEGHGQEMNLRGVKQAATVLLPRRTPNPLVMVPNNLTTDRLNTTGINGRTNIGAMMQHTQPNPLFMPPTAPFATPIQAQAAPPPVPQWSSVHQPASGVNINDLAGGRKISSPAATTQGQLMNVQGMTRLAPTPLSLSLITPDLIVVSNNTSAENRLDMTERFYGQTNIGGMMQHPLPSPSFTPPLEPFAISNVQSMASGLDTTNDGFINASTRTLTGDGHFDKRIQHASPPFLPREFPRRLGLPPVPPVQHDASAIDMLNNENRGNTIGFTNPGTTLLDQSSFGDEYSWNAIDFPEPATPGLNQSNFENGTSNGIWDDLDVDDLNWYCN